MSLRMILSLVALLTLSSQISNLKAAPIFGIGQTESSTALTTLSTDQTDAFVRPARFSQIAYCSPGAVLSWKCGPPCDALPGVKPIVTGGNDGIIPFYYVAHDPTSQSIIVAHQGTDSSNILSIANDVQILLEPLDQTLFPNVDSSIKTHDGFAKTFARTAPDILGNITAALQSFGVSKVQVHGHSLGAAVAVMDAVFLRQHLDPSVSISTVVFGLPRSGNQAWADFVDQNAPGLVHVHNRNDIVGTVPPRAIDYQHFSGEIHIQDTGSLNCSGQENQGQGCIDSQSIFNSSVADHIGPYYDNISMSRGNCPL
ncbi:alpha/beta-hydrolase [Hysterangium stoloniferum]|nr:alpha/beta-hydrolase [Hysterangium stoloniferum]